jgi:hypothetical protein
MKALILSAALMLGVAATAMAQITQPVTFNVFGKSLRQPGTYPTASAQIPDGVYTIGIKDTMSDQDASDPANNFILTGIVSQDGVDWTPNGVTVVALYREQWQGGTHFDKRTQSMVPNHINTSFGNSALASGVYNGWRVRADLDLAVRLSVGFDVTVYPPGISPQ